jgi:large-conductance mechanosensitive channel
MFSFLLEEGVITVGTISGLFTASMLNSFRLNILEPTLENLVPSYKLDISQFGESSLENIMKVQASITGKDPKLAKVIKWQTFLKDFITWVFLMFCLYLFWKKVLHKYKKTN